MKTTKKSRTDRIVADLMAPRAYKGFYLYPSPFDYAWRIQKDGQHIATCESLGAAMNAVDEITD